MGKTITRPPETPESAKPVEREQDEPTVYVGTWEDMQTHAGDLTGKTVRVTALPERGRILRVEDLPKLPENISAAGAFAKVDMGLDFGPSDLSSRHKGAFSEIMDEKYGKGGR